VPLEVRRRPPVPVPEGRCPRPLVKRKLQEFAVSLGVARNADGRSVEVYPKQEATQGESTAGNWINLPYYHAEDSPRFAVAEGRPIGFTEFLAYATDMAVSSHALEAVQPAESGGMFEDGPPCLQHLHQIGITKGTRNQTLVNIGVYFRAKDPDRVEELLDAYNAECMTPPLPQEEVQNIARSLKRREYVYTCSQVPLSDHCRKTECKKRKFGVGVFRSTANEGKFPELANLRKITTDPPRWLIQVGDQDVSMTTDELLNMPKFRRAVFERLTLVVPTLKNHQWEEKVETLVATVTVIAAPEDAGTFGQFQAYLAQFLETRRSADSREALLLGKPWEEEGKVYFRSPDLYAFLERKRFKEYNMSQIWDQLRRLGADKFQFQLKKSCVQVWWLPVEGFVAGEQQEPFELPVRPEPTF
jgi:hypothetical protein